MSSIIRRIQRNSKPHSPKWMGRGSKLGVKNRMDPCVTGKRKARKPWRSKANAPKPKPAMVFKDSPRQSPADRREAHKAKMRNKARHNRRMYEERRRVTVQGADINRRTGKPHEHKREIARRQRQAGMAS